MSEPRIDRWALSGPASRRQTILASFLGALVLLSGGHEATAKKRVEQHKKHCGPCKKRKKGKCKPKPNGTPCGDGGTCQGGTCQEPPPDPTCAETCEGCCSGATCAPGAYKAWLSDDTGSPSTRFMRSPGPYQLVNETVIANDWAELSSGTLQAPINRDENGDDLVPLPSPVPKVWTNTRVDGTLRDAGADCESWTTENAAGGVGVATASDANWTDSEFEFCGILGRLYCFQQS